MLSVNLHDFLEELRRRRVFRTAAAYLAGAFVVLQVADLTFEPLGLSVATYRWLVIVAGIGFPIVLLLSWFLDLKGHRERPAVATVAEGDVVRARPRRATTLAVFAAVLVGVAAMTWFAIGRFKTVDDDRRAAIAVLPFDVIGDPQLDYLETGIVEMISRNVDGAAGLRAVPPEMVLAAAK